MKKYKTIKQYTGRDWEMLSALLSGEPREDGDLLSRFVAEDSHNTVKCWKELSDMDNKEINVDRAWGKLYSRLNDNGMIQEARTVTHFYRSLALRKIAAMALIILGIGSGLVYLGNKGLLSNKTTVATTDNQKNLQVTLPDGSNVYLNRNTEISYHRNFGRRGRSVSLSGEAFFEITADPASPFTVDAGKAMVKVIGTSFNVITDNEKMAVEVFVKSGKVMLSDNAGAQNIELEDGFIGTMNSENSGKTLNNNPNYLAWNTGSLVYDGQTLDIVFRDLKKVYNMEIVAGNPSILEKTWTSPIDNQPQETIIRLICTSFNLSYSKDGNVYHLNEN